MTINVNFPTHTTPRIAVVGVGGAGGNAIDNMIDKMLEGVDFYAANTDAQALSRVKADKVIHLGKEVTKGLGAGSNPERGALAAEESVEDILNMLENYNMVFITAGMGGGTGTGAAPIIAQAAKEKGILTVAVVSKPFAFEGKKRLLVAEAGIEQLEKHVDTLLVIPNQNLFSLANERTTLSEAFAMADEVLNSGVSGITNLMIKDGLINLDFADVNTIMSDNGRAMMGQGKASGDGRAREATLSAIANPLLDGVSISGAKGVLLSVSGARDDLTLFEIEEAASTIKEQVDEDANIIFGAIFDDTLDGQINVSIVATGLEAVQKNHTLQREEGVTTLSTLKSDTTNIALQNTDGKNKDSVEVNMSENHSNTSKNDDTNSFTNNAVSQKSSQKLPPLSEGIRVRRLNVDKLNFQQTHKDERDKQEHSETETDNKLSDLSNEEKDKDIDKSELAEAQNGTVKEMRSKIMSFFIDGDAEKDQDNSKVFHEENTHNIDKDETSSLHTQSDSYSQKNDESSDDIKENLSIEEDRNVVNTYKVPNYQGHFQRQESLEIPAFLRGRGKK